MSKPLNQSILISPSTRLVISGGRLLVGDHVLGLVEPAEERLESLFQLTRVQQSPVQTLVTVGHLIELCKLGLNQSLLQMLVAVGYLNNGRGLCKG